MTQLYKNKYRSATARAQWWDYTRDAAYFVTICTQDRAPVFGAVRNGEMHLSDIGHAAQACWDSIPDHFVFATSGAFVVMPNHVHGILILDHNGTDRRVVNDGGDHAGMVGDGMMGDGPDAVGSGAVVSVAVGTLHATSNPATPIIPPADISEPPSPPKNERMATISPKPGSLSTIIRSYKSAVTKMVRPAHPHFGWQTRFHDHIIRDGRAYERIEQYIIANPMQWDQDKLNQPIP